MKIFIKGLLTGLFLQLAVGPVFFFIVNLSLQRTIYDGLAGALAVTIADYIYISLAILGVGRLLEKRNIKRVFGIISSIVLIVFGILMIKNIPIGVSTGNLATDTLDLFSSFTSVFIITITSPMTIVFWTSIFTAKAGEYNFSKKELIIFGMATGLATLIFMGTSAVLFSTVKTTVPIELVQILNIVVAGILIFYGATRLWRNTTRGSAKDKTTAS